MGKIVEFFLVEQQNLDGRRPVRDRAVAHGRRVETAEQPRMDGAPRNDKQESPVGFDRKSLMDAGGRILARIRQVIDRGAGPRRRGLGSGCGVRCGRQSGSGRSQMAGGGQAGSHFAGFWLHHFRRLVTGWEYHVENFFGMVRRGCMQILLRYL